MEKRLLFFNTRHLFARDYFLDVVELIQSLKGCEIIDVEAQDFITDLAEYRIIKLEEAQLHAFARSGDLCSRLTYAAYLGILGLQLL